MRLIVDGNIVNSECDLLINTVNCVNVMGKGVALAFKNKFPSIMGDYAKLCDRYNKNRIRPGDAPILSLGQRHWCAFASKDHWRDPSKLEWIELGFVNLVNNLKDFPIKTIALPPPGAGNGGLSIVDVYPYLSMLDGYDVEFYITRSQEYELARNFDISTLSRQRIPKKVTRDNDSQYFFTM